MNAKISGIRNQFLPPIVSNQDHKATVITSTNTLGFQKIPTKIILDPLNQYPTHNLLSSKLNPSSCKMLVEAAKLTPDTVKVHIKAMTIAQKSITAAVNNLTKESSKPITTLHPHAVEFAAQLSKYENLQFISLGENKPGYWMTSKKPLPKDELTKIKDNSLKQGRLTYNISANNDIIFHEDTDGGEISNCITAIATKLSVAGWEQQQVLQKYGAHFKDSLAAEALKSDNPNFTEIQAPPSAKNVARLVEKIKDCGSEGITAASVTAINDTVRFQLMVPFKHTGEILAKFQTAFLNEEISIVSIKDRYKKPSGAGWSDVSITLKINGVLAEVLVTTPMTGVIKELWPSHGAYEVIRNPDNKEMKAESTKSMRIIQQSMLLLSILHEFEMLQNIDSPKALQDKVSPFKELSKKAKAEFNTINENKNKFNQIGENKALEKDQKMAKVIEHKFGLDLNRHEKNSSSIDLDKVMKNSFANIASYQHQLSLFLTDAANIGLLTPHEGKNNLQEMNALATNIYTDKLNSLGLDATKLIEQFNDDATNYFGITVM